MRMINHHVYLTILVLLLFPLLDGYQASIGISSRSPLPKLKSNLWKTSLQFSLSAISVEDIQVGIYDLQLKFSSLVESDLHNRISPIITVILISAGVLSSLSPCSLGLIPITLSYLLEPSTKEDMTKEGAVTAISISSRPRPTVASSESYMKLGFYSMGVILAFTILGGSASIVGNTVNKLSVPGINLIRDYGIPAIYLSLGLSLLEILPPINLAVISSLLKGSDKRIISGTENDASPWKLLLQRAGKGIFVGLTAAIVGTSCTTPVLTALLTFIGNQANTQTAILALLFYSLGYLLPLVFSLVVVNQIKLSDFGGRLLWINDLFAVLMLGYGSYLLFNSLLQGFS